MLETQVQESLHLQHTSHQISLDRALLHELAMVSVNSSSDYFAHLCIPVSETAQHQKRMPVENLSFSDKTTEIKWKSKPW
jgi:hypothetical protein